MIVGIPKEIKNNESRVGMTPAGVFELVKNNHTVYVQSGAGEGSGFFNRDYQQVGAVVLDTIGQVYAMSEMIVKVKEPIEEEYDLIQAGQILFTYFHFASSEALTKAMIKQKLADRREAVIPRFMKFIPIRLLCWISLKMMKKANDRLVEKRSLTGQYRSSGIISNLGLLPLTKYQGGGFKARSIFFIPPDFDTTAFFLTVTGNEKGLELVLRLPKVLATRGRMNIALDDIEHEISAHHIPRPTKNTLQRAMPI